MLRELNTNEMEMVSGGTDTGWTQADTIYGSKDPLSANSSTNDAIDYFGGYPLLGQSSASGLNGATPPTTQTADDSQNCTGHDIETRFNGTVDNGIDVLGSNLSPSSGGAEAVATGIVVYVGVVTAAISHGVESGIHALGGHAGCDG